MAPRRSKRQRRQREANGEGYSDGYANDSNENENTSNNANANANANTISAKLQLLGIAMADLEDCDSLQEEFKKIKKSYFRKILVAHPDKGGDPEAFQTLQNAFEEIRRIFSKGLVASFADADLPTSHRDRSQTAAPFPSWDFYAEAAQQEMPKYRVELAKSGRSQCRYCREVKDDSDRNLPVMDPKIPKNSVRAGSLDTMSGTYSRWYKLACWRVPKVIWRGLPDPQECQDPALFHEALTKMNHVLLCGFDEMPPDDQALVVNHVMEKKHWASISKPHGYAHAPKRASSAVVPKQTKKQRKKKKLTPGSAKKKIKEEAQGKANKEKEQETQGSAKEDEGATTVTSPPKSKSLVTKKPKKQEQLVAVPGALAAASVMQGKTVVLTGVFPSVGGGGGLNMGKDRMKAILESMGAKVRSSVSGKTDMVILGEEPGLRKVSDARERPNCRLVGIQDLQLVLEGKKELKALPAEPEIEGFSTGYYNNALKLEDVKYGGILG